VENTLFHLFHFLSRSNVCRPALVINKLLFAQDKFQYNARGDNPENKNLTLYMVPEKDAESAFSMKPSKSLTKALCDCSMQSENGQFANHTCCTMHRNVNIEIVTVQAVVDDEHSNPITTVNPDVIVILRADQGIVMGEWIKTQYTDIHLNLDRIFACGCCFHAGKCQPHQTKLRNLCWRNSWKHKPLI